MTDISEVRTQFERARRQERSAANEMAGFDRQFENQQSQLESLLTHKEECMNGLKNAKQTGLTIVQMREYKLLLDHVNHSVEQQQIKVDISQEKLEDSKVVWTKKHERYDKLNVLLEQLETERKEAMEAKLAETQRNALARKLEISETAIKEGKEQAEKDIASTLIGKRL